MRWLKSVVVVVVLAFIFCPIQSYAGLIKASATPSNASILKGEQIDVPINIDVSELPEQLGSYTASLTWDAHVLKYISSSSGKTDGFDKPMVNIKKSAEGKIIFAAANPFGAEGDVNVLNVEFEVVGDAGTDAALELEFTAMSAAKTFANLLPYVHVSKMVGAFRVAELPKEFALLQNHPNPFNPTTMINYDLPKDEHVELKIFNLRGQVVRTLVNDQIDAGSHAIQWDGKDGLGREVPAGVYVYRVQAGEFSSVKKMLLVK